MNPSLIRKGLGLIAGAVIQFLKPTAAILVVIFAIAICVMIGEEIRENWGSIVCWENDETNSLSRACAAYKITQSSSHEGIEVLQVTGIADESNYVKRVEFKWRVKSNLQNPVQPISDATVLFRKYDDGWRLSNSLQPVVK